MIDAHDPAQNFIDALYASDKEGRYLPLFSTKCEEYRYKGLCGEDCPEYGSEEECEEVEPLP